MPGGGFEIYYTAKLNPPASRSSSGCLGESLAVPGHPVWVSRGTQRKGSSCAPWGSSPTSCPWYRFWTFLGRRWGTSWWRCSSPTISRFPSRLSQCKISSSSRRSRKVLRAPQTAEQLAEVLTVVSFFPLCSSLPSGSLTFQFRVVVGIQAAEVFKVVALATLAWCRAAHGKVLFPMKVVKDFSQNRIQQRLFLGRSLTFQFVVEVYKVFTQDRVHQHLPRRVLTFLFPVEFLTLILGRQPHSQLREMRRFK